MVDPRPQSSSGRIEMVTTFSVGAAREAALSALKKRGFGEDPIHEEQSNAPQDPHKVTTASAPDHVAEKAHDDHKEKMWAGQSNMLVAVRVRPLRSHDRSKRECIRVLDRKMVVVLDPSSENQNDILRQNRTREKKYAFDHVFEPEDSNEVVYSHTTKFLIDGILNGFNATVFAYGNTGAGKTYTMLGTPEKPGIMMLTLDDLFDDIKAKQNDEAHGVDYKVSVSFLEVYNENIRDLLAVVNGRSDDYLDLREDPLKGPVVAGITEIEASSSKDVMGLLRRGNRNRTQEPTAANKESSRSHAVLQVVVEQRDRAPETGNRMSENTDNSQEVPVMATVRIGKLSLIDLAGSERAAATQNRGARMIEGANINRSLLALGNCINALGEKGGKGTFVPYRDSKLTRLLKDSLGGNCRTVMIANISPSLGSFEETLNTLKYANRAKNIKTNVTRNVLSVNYHISEYVNLITGLKSQIAKLRHQILCQQDKPERDHSRNTQHGRVGTAEREEMSSYRHQIEENFKERMQLRRSLIELEDKNVANSLAVSKRQLQLAEWEQHQQLNNHPSGIGGDNKEFKGNNDRKLGDLSDVETDTEYDSGISDAEGGRVSRNKKHKEREERAGMPDEIRRAIDEVQQMRKAIDRNNAMKRSIAKRLRNNERKSEKFREELTHKITSSEFRELMELEYRIGKLELDNMELEQSRIVHETIVRGKDLTIQKLQLQLAQRDALIAHQQQVLQANDIKDEGLEKHHKDLEYAKENSCMAEGFDTLRSGQFRLMNCASESDLSIPASRGSVQGSIVSNSSACNLHHQLPPSNYSDMETDGSRADSRLSICSTVVPSIPPSPSSGRGSSLGFGVVSPIPYVHTGVEDESAMLETTRELPRNLLNKQSHRKQQNASIAPMPSKHHDDNGKRDGRRRASRHSPLHNPRMMAPKPHTPRRDRRSYPTTTKDRRENERSTREGERRRNRVRRGSRSRSPGSDVNGAEVVRVGKERRRRRRSKEQLSDDGRGGAGMVAQGYGRPQRDESTTGINRRVRRSNNGKHGGPVLAQPQKIASQRNISSKENKVNKARQDGGSSLAKAGGFMVAGGPKTDYENMVDDYGLPRIKEALDLEATTAYIHPNQRTSGGGNVAGGNSNAITDIQTQGAQQAKQKQQLTGLKQRLKKKQQGPSSVEVTANPNHEAVPIEVNLTMDGISIGGTSSNYRPGNDAFHKNESAKEQLSTREVHLQYLDNELVSVINPQDRDQRDSKKRGPDKVAPAPLELDMKIAPAPITEAKVPLPGGNTGVGGTVQPINVASNGQNANPNLDDINDDLRRHENPQISPSSFSSAALVNAGVVAIGYQRQGLHENQRQASSNEVIVS